MDRRLLTVYHPQTDRSTEKMNSIIKAYFRVFIDWDQKNQARLYPFVQLAVKNRETFLIKINLFFLQHGYDVDIFQLDFSSFIRNQILRTNKLSTDNILSKLRGVFNLVQAKIAENQQEQEKQMNQHRKKTLKLIERDKVWLKLGKQFSIKKDNKKFNQKNTKYIIKKVINSYLIKLDISKGFNDVFHVDKLYLANIDPLSSQSGDDVQSFSIQKDGEEGFVVENIMAEMKNKKERRWKKQYEIKWKGYA